MSTPAFSNERPIEFVTIVLRAAVQGLLKCCCLTWIELAKGGVYDVRFILSFFWTKGGSISSFPLDRRLAERQMWNIVTRRDSCTFHSFQTRWSVELVRAKRQWWNVFVAQKENSLIRCFSVWILENCVTSKDSPSKSMLLPFLASLYAEMSLNLGASPNYECRKYNASVHPPWSYPVCSRTTPCDAIVFTGVLTGFASSARLRSIYRSTFADVHSDPNDPPTWFPKDV